jgi:hypothetical protein
MTELTPFGPNLRRMVESNRSGSKERVGLEKNDADFEKPKETENM